MRRQRWTEVSWTPRIRAMVEGDSPCSSKSTARRRRRSSSVAVPIGLVIPHYTAVQHERQALTTRDSVNPTDVSLNGAASNIDLAASAVIVTPETVGVGGTVHVTWTVQNATGNAVTGDW